MKIEFYGNPTKEEKTELCKGLVRESKLGPGIVETYMMKAQDGRVIGIRRNIWEEE